MSIRKKYYLWSILLILVVFLVWGMFYLYLTQLIQKNTQAQLDSTASQIMKDLGDEFNNLEQITFTLTQSEKVKLFAAEDDIKEYFARSEDIDEMLLGMISGQNLIGSIIIYNEEGAYYRFRGSPGNTACERIFYLMKDRDAPGHLIVKTNESRLIGYGSGVYAPSNQQIGSVAVLLDEAAILGRLHKYNQPDTLHISVAAKDEIIISDTPGLLGQRTKAVRANSYYFAEKYIGITPFSILVTADIGYLSDSQLLFTVAVIITGLVLGISLLIFGFAMRKHFFSPMMQILKRVEHLELNNEPGALASVGSEEFDKLIVKLNEMLKKIDVKNKGIQEAMLLVKNTEIKKQKAMVLSLKKQINAHFTVNILNIIRILVTKKELERAAALCDGLSMLVRYAHDENEFINAWDEFFVLQSYVNIMNIRYDDKFVVNFDLDDRLMDYRIPRMLLQPIVENSVVHGYRNRKKECIIDISARVMEEKIEILIRDEGEGLTEESLNELQKRIGSQNDDSETTGGIENVALINIGRRIRYYYGERGVLSLKQVSPQGLEVLVSIGLAPCTELEFKRSTNTTDSILYSSENYKKSN